MATIMGGLLGLLVGVVIEAAVWMYAFGAAMSGRSSVTVPLIVTTSTADGDVVATSGPGILILPFVLLAVGAVIGLLLSRRASAAPTLRESSAPCSSPTT
ncbi:hypothetical protein [Galbitalea soli]|uniref:Uncharacterized protein n=1 Tax=Galbitalea soli TaxID=1268042 RepID=A0A7C9PP07_9MICO|nr:hypothetical protein [Galbitalea soli]NEM92034.1 hypothetical protein [Galbitalea soli]NYJ32014.1 hypothetical protein [Galbitalea soli]